MKKVSFAKLYHAATDTTVDWPQPVKEWADQDPAHMAILRHIRALLPAHPSNATTVVALCKEVLAEMEAVPEPVPHDVAGKPISGKELPPPDAVGAVDEGRAEPIHPDGATFADQSVPDAKPFDAPPPPPKAPAKGKP